MALVAERSRLTRSLQVEVQKRPKRKDEWDYIREERKRVSTCRRLISFRPAGVEGPHGSAKVSLDVSQSKTFQFSRQYWGKRRG